VDGEECPKRREVTRIDLDRVEQGLPVLLRAKFGLWDKVDDSPLSFPGSPFSTASRIVFDSIFSSTRMKRVSPPVSLSGFASKNVSRAVVSALSKTQ